MSMELVQVSKDKREVITLIKPDENETKICLQASLSTQFKKDLIKARKDIKEGKYTRYNNAQEILDEFGL